MSAIIKIKDVSQLVRSLLTRFEHYRDSDEKLCAHIWARQLGMVGYDTKSMTGHELLVLYAEGKLISSMSIERSRRLIQNKYLELRGSKWAERHREEEIVRSEINK